MKSEKSKYLVSTSWKEMRQHERAHKNHKLDSWREQAPNRPSCEHEPAQKQTRASITLKNEEHFHY
jgi:hypothetical protein